MTPQTGQGQPKINITPFAVAQSEITVAQYQICVEAGVCEPPIAGVGCNYGVKGREAHPMNCVSWFQARRFSRWVGGDLPSEGQWESLASAHFSQAYPWGDEAPSCERVHMFGEEKSGCDQKQTAPVCSKPKGHSKEGVCDLIGSVWEWVLDLHHEREGDMVDQQPKCDVATCDQNLVAPRVSKGGSWVNSAVSQQVKLRDRTTPAYMFNFIGFRPVRAQK